MKERRILIALLPICIAVLLMLFYGVDTAYAAKASLPLASDNLTTSLRKNSGLTVVSDGYMRVFYDGEQVQIEYYDKSFNIKRRKSIAMELKYWGGFFAGENHYYLIEGKANTAEKEVEVIRVIKYSKAWKKLGTAKIKSNPELFGGDVTYPFDAGCVEATEYNGKLYIVTGHEGYVDDAVGQGHQGFLMIEVDQSTMKGAIVECDLWHSFAQYIKNKGENLYILEQSEGSRCTQLSRCTVDDPERESISVFDYGGSRTSAWAVECYASVDGMALSDDNILCLGTSINQSLYDEATSDTPHNVYLTVTPMSDFTQEATKTKKLTAYTGNGRCFLGAKITKINNNRFMISWEVADSDGTAKNTDSLSGYKLHYIFVDGDGNKISDKFTARAPISECQPIVNGNKVVYYASSGNMVNFYTINANTGKFSKRIYRVAGTNATWSLKNGTMTVSGKGKICVDRETHFRYPISSTASYYTYSSNDNCWNPIRSRVKKLIVKGSITGIAKESFAGFTKLKEVRLRLGVKFIGKEAFYGCTALEKITIPVSVKTIGKDILWTGSTWYSGGHVYRAAIYAPSNAYAKKYAKKYDITYQKSNAGLPGATTKISKKMVKKTVVKISWKKVTGATGYQVFYKKKSSDKWISLGRTTGLSITKKNLKRKTTYQFRVRAYTKVNGIRYRSPQRKTITVKTK